MVKNLAINPIFVKKEIRQFSLNDTIFIHFLYFEKNKTKNSETKDVWKQTLLSCFSFIIVSYSSIPLGSHHSIQTTFQQFRSFFQVGRQRYSNYILEGHQPGLNKRQTRTNNTTTIIAIRHQFRFQQHV